MKTKYYRVKTGYGKDDFISIDETELSKALRAQIKGSVAVFAEGSVSGNSILTITPDYQRMMGWNRNYSLTGEDYDEIGKALPRECMNLIVATQEELRLN
jgi:hypothetical protein